ncbi:MBL fold metallo-hydrolase [Catellatospora sp. TT07R-123]|uniref:MBL fold metallo-hydrolase n=1 Tax=Catellatospora sp. TT07R-123 TaxID=2733863 RepID=UPI001BB3F46A|nr:MBL fold metallo-hydrolase [Catellatospora sp. TT07R-123]
MQRRALLRRAVLGGAAVGAAAAGLPAVAAPAAAAAPVRAGSGPAAGVSMRWLGVSGWEIAFDGRVLYFDPFLSRFDYRLPGGPLAVDPTVVDRLLATGRLAGPPELIMISHGHWDHLSDVPSLLARPDWAATTIRTVSTETHRHLMQAMGVSDARRKNNIVATGGEDLDFGDGAYRVQVIRSLHSQSLGYGFFAPGTRVAPPPAPTSINDLVEGGTLAYHVTIADRLKVLLFGGTNFVERELAGLRPDVVAVCMTDHSSLHRYLERLLTTLGGPRYVIPVHHDDMITGFDDPNLADTVNRAAVTQLKDAVRQLRLRTEVIEAEHLRPMLF